MRAGMGLGKGGLNCGSNSLSAFTSRLFGYFLGETRKYRRRQALHLLLMDTYEIPNGAALLGMTNWELPWGGGKISSFFAASRL